MGNGRVTLVLVLTIGSAVGGRGFLDAYFYMVPPEGRISVVDSTRNSTPILSFLDQPSVVEWKDEIPPEIQGYVIVSSPLDACKPVKPSPGLLERDSYAWLQGSPEEYQDDDGDGGIPGPTPGPGIKMEWILLASKSNCSYNTKIDHADAAGFGGILIFNVGSNGTEVIGLEEEKNNLPFDIRIPSFFIGAYDGWTLRSIFTNDPLRRYSVVIETTPPYYKDVIYYALWSSFGLFLFVILLCLAKPAYECSLQPWIRARYRRRRKTLLTRAVSSLAIVEWKEEMLDKYETCVICMEYYGDQEQLRILPCNHGFHTNCIDSWLLKVRRVCPICKEKIIYSSCWEDFSDSDISEGNYFTDIAYEPLTPVSNTSGRRGIGIFETRCETRDFVNLGLGGGDGRGSVHGSSSLDSDSIGSSSFRFETDGDGTGHITTSASFVSTTVSVHQPTESRRRLSGSGEWSGSIHSHDGDGDNEH